MHLLYLDESGSIDDPAQNHFVLAGVAVFERKTHWIEQSLNDVAKRFSPQDPYSIELHGSPMFAGRGQWRHFKKIERVTAIQDALKHAIIDQKFNGVRLFGAVIKKSILVGASPVEFAFEQLCSRFDLFLKREYAKFDDPQRGLILFDKSTTERRVQTLALEFKSFGHKWGQTKNYAEVPVFLDSKASRLIQLADLVSYAIYRHFESKDDTFFEIIKNSFDVEGGVQHGFYTKI